jgi:hypothetical protein
MKRGGSEDYIMTVIRFPYHLRFEGKPGIDELLN